MKIVLGDAQVFSDAITAVSRLVDEVLIKTTEEGLEIIAMDPANVGMVHLLMKAEAFKEYVADNEGFGLKLSNFKQILARRDKSAVITLSVENNQLKITMVGKTTKNFTTPLLELEQKEVKVPDLKFKAEITISNSELRDAIADVEIVAESTDFKVKDNRFTISASGDTGKAISETKGIVKLLGEDKDALSKYSIEYLNNMMSTKFNTLKVSLGKTYPLRLDYVSDDKLTSLTFILAPRVESD